MSEMTFEKFLRSTSLPTTAKEQLSKVLSLRMQAKLLNRLDAEEVIASAIEDVDQGSVETLETLIREKLKEPRG